jgi:hypothetical protein
MSSAGYTLVMGEVHVNLMDRSTFLQKICTRHKRTGAIADEICSRTAYRAIKKNIFFCKAQSGGKRQIAIAELVTIFVIFL